MSDISALVKQATDSIALSANVNYELNMRRREAIRPNLNQDYKHLCSSTVPVTDYLFGDELSKQLKEMAEANRVSSKVGTNNKSRPQRSGYNSHQHSGTRSKDFGYKSNRNFCAKRLN